MHPATLLVVLLLGMISTLPYHIVVPHPDLTRESLQVMRGLRASPGPGVRQPSPDLTVAMLLQGNQLFHKREYAAAAEVLQRLVDWGQGQREASSKIMHAKALAALGASLQV